MAFTGATKVFTGSILRDDQGVPLQVTNTWQAEDATATTIKSPLTVSSTEIDLSVPTNAVTFTIRADDADVRVAIANGGTAAAPYYVVRDGTTETFPCGKLATIHLLRDAAVDAVVQFRFETI